MFNPALETHPEETALIGLLVAGYTELDLSLCSLCGIALSNKQSVLGALHKVSSEQIRIDVSNRLARHVFQEHGLIAEFGEAIGAITHCRKIRNQYAHAQWVTHNETLHFVRAENVNFKQPPESIKWRTTTVLACCRF